MAVATVLVMVLPALIVGALSTLGVLTSVWAGALLAVALSLALSSAGSAYWRRHASGDVLFSDLLLWGWLRRRRTERRLARADELLRQAGDADSARKGELLRELGAALDAQDPYLDGHSRRVARYVTMIARRMNLSVEQVERAKAAATIHDVGKLRIPEEIVSKPGRLSEAEFELMKQHSAAGGGMVECLGDPALAAAVRGHHERWDGSGYPDGFAGERIPLEARLISVADTFDAISSARPYRAATAHAKALNVIADEAGEQLDPEAARAFISCYSDRRGAAFWAGLASLPRQLASRLSTSPGELTGALAAALTAPMIVAAGAAGAAAMPLRSDQPANDPPRAAAVAGSPGTPQPDAPTSTAPTTVTPGPGPPAGGTDQIATSTFTPGAGAAERSLPLPQVSGTPAPPVDATPALAPESPLLPNVLPATLPTAPVPPLPTSAPTAAPESKPTPSPEPQPQPQPEPEPEPEPEPQPEPEPTPEPWPPPVAATLPVFPTATSTPSPPSHTREDCKHGGWRDLGYRNQGQCIAAAGEGRPHG